MRFLVKKEHAHTLGVHVRVAGVGGTLHGSCSRELAVLVKRVGGGSRDGDPFVHLLDKFFNNVAI